MAVTERSDQNQPQWRCNFLTGSTGACGAAGEPPRINLAHLALSPDLDVLGQWPVDPQHRGHHAICPDRGLALISGPDEVRLLDHTGRARWRHPHAPWTGAFESGCTWFDEAGQLYAVVPAASYDRCLVVCLDPDSGQPLAATTIQARAAGISPVYHPDGWVGLSEGEGQDAAQAWWAWSASQFPGQMRIEVRWRHDRERAPKGGGNDGAGVISTAPEPATTSEDKTSYHKVRLEYESR